MNCDQYLELMSAALDGECTAEERRQLDSHLAVCPECADLFHTISENANAMRNLDCEVPAGLKDRIMSNLPEQEKSVKTGKVIHWKRWVPVAAAACLVLVVSLLPGRLGVTTNKADEAPRATPVPSMAVEYFVAGSDNECSMSGYEVAPSTAPQPSAEPAPGVADPNYGTNPSEPADVGSVIKEKEDGQPAEPAHYWMGTQQTIRVGYSDELIPGAQIVGSTASLHEYLSQFTPQAWDAEGNPIRNTALDVLSGTYTEDYFRTHRLLCVVVVSGSGSIRYEFAPQGLYWNSVLILEQVPEVGTCDMAAWLLVAEVDSMFDDGDILDVNFIR